MTELPLRAPALNWGAHYDPRWQDADPVATHAFDALSLLIPWGEGHIIEVAGRVLATVDLSGHGELRGLVEDVIVQETIHSRQHHRYNELLGARGHVGDFGRLQRWHKDAMERLHGVTRRRFSFLTRLAFVCAFEHYTAVVGDYILDHPGGLAHAPAELRLVWGWHAAEEVEHKAICFDLYRACGGGEARRATVFVLATAAFALLFALIYFRLLRQDGTWRPGRRSAVLGRVLAGLAGRGGIGRHLLHHFLRYLRPGFHPWEHDNRCKADAWFAENADRVRTAVRRGPSGGGGTCAT